MTITITVTDASLSVAGDPLADWRLTARQSFNAPDSGTVTVPATPANVALMQPGNRIVVARNGVVFMAGPIETPFDYSWSISGEDATPGALTVQFTDDLAKIVGYLTYPTPANTSETQTVTAAYTRTATNGETVMRDLVNLNCGPGALAARRIPHLVLGAVAGVGSNINFASRFGNLGDDLRSAAIAAGGLGFYTTQAGSNIEFRVFAPRDLTGNVVFSRSRNNLTRVRYTSKAPTRTCAIVGGQGEGTARTIKEVRDATAEAAWWRVESFVDQRQTNDMTVLTQAGNEEVARGAASYTLATVTIDTDLQRYGDDYLLGDKVSVEVLPGLVVNDIIRQVQLDASPRDGEVITSVVGTQEATTDPTWLQFGRALATQLAKVQRR